MRILFIFSNFHLSSITGQPGVVSRILRETTVLEGDVFLISNAPAQYSKGNNIPKDYEYEALLLDGVGNLRTYIFNFGKIVSYVRAVKPDLIFSHGLAINIFSWFINLFFGLPFFCSLCETLETLNPVYSKVLVFCLKKATNVFVSCDFIKEELVREGVSPTNITVVRTGIAEHYFESEKISNYENDVLFFGDAKKNRGFDIVYEIAKDLPDLRFKILLRWKEQDCAGLLEKMKKLSNTSVLFYPYEKDLKQFILESKIVLLPYRWMGVRIPVSLLESMALGKCVVTSEMGGNDEIIEDGKNGFLFSFSDLEEVKGTIAFLVKNRSVFEEVGRKAEETIGRVYSDRAYKRISDVIHKVI